MQNGDVMSRYSRQIFFSKIGEMGQQKIRMGRVLIIGCGALGTVNAEMLVRAGVGQLKIVDRDYVEENNLQRQSLFTEDDAREGLPKAIAAMQSLQKINTEVHLEAIVQDVTWENIGALCEGSEIIVDGTDNFETRFLINDISVKRGTPWVYGACVGSYGIAFAFQPTRTPCLQCLLEQPPGVGSPDSCDTVGIVAPVVHAVAACQVTHTLKLLVGKSPEPRFLQVDVWSSDWRTIEVGRAPNQSCSCCVERQFRFLEGKQKSRLTRLCGDNAVQVSPQRGTQVDFKELSQRLGKTVQLKFNKYIMRIWANGYEISLFTDGRSIVKGTEDFSEARAVYAKYIGS